MRPSGWHNARDFVQASDGVRNRTEDTGREHGIEGSVRERKLLDVHFGEVDVATTPEAHPSALKHAVTDVDCNRVHSSRVIRDVRARPDTHLKHLSGELASDVPAPARGHLLDWSLEDLVETMRS